MNELSERLSEAVDFLRKNGYAKNAADVARRIGVSKPTMSMAMSGSRVPTWDLLLDLCDAYPVNFRWLRTGEGDVVRDDTEARLLKRIRDLEEEIRVLKE